MKSRSTEPAREAVFVGQRVERLTAVSDGSDHADDPVINAGVRPDTLGHFGVGGGQFDRVHLRLAVPPRRFAARCSRSRCRAPTPASGRRGGPRRRAAAPFSSPTFTSIDFSVANVSMVASTSSMSPRLRIGLDVGRAGLLPAVADLAGPDEVGHADREAPERRTQERQPPFHAHGRQPMPMAQRNGLQCCPRVCPCQIIRPVKLARMFAMALRCTTTDGGAETA